ncbi:lymphocyte antigen 75 [Mustelus asterias]
MKSWCSTHIHLCFLLIFAECWAITSSQSTGDGIFAIQHQATKKCLQVGSSRMTMENCNPQEQFQQWKWVSAHRLFNIGSKTCLGLDSYNKEQPLKMFECDAEVTTLWWRCNNSTLYGSSSYKVTVKNGSPSVSINATDAWKQSAGGYDVCEQPFRNIYTTDGNAFGKPCVFPFKYRRKWFYECTTERNDDQEWCATTANYEKDRKWGNCLKPDTECKTFWEKDSTEQTCYQFNFQSFLSWSDARLSCQTQGGDLLSIADLKEQKYISEQSNVPKKMWIGLNQLNMAAGWQWSDGTPLAFVNWDDGRFGLYHLEESSCAALNSDSDGRWQTGPCEAALPYVCKKPFNRTRTESSDPWKYFSTECEAGWLEFNGFCFYMNTKELKWDDANNSCKSKESQLISIHSLADVELIVSKLHEDYRSDIWTGLRSNQFPAWFKWSDGSSVTFTYWDLAQPTIPPNTTKHCVSYAGKWGRWSLADCDRELPYVCKKPGRIRNETGRSDVGCPQNEPWERHGNYCYKVDSSATVEFESKCHLTIQSRFEQEFINSLIAKQTTENGKYFWTSFQDKNGTGEYTWFTTHEEKEPVTYTNWNAYQPASPGECVVMATGKALGRWEVKNCKSFKAMSICKKSIGNTTETEETHPTGSCPTGWQTNADLDQCYKVFHHERVVRKRTWEEAERFCEALGAHLPSFSHNDEILYLHNLLRNTISDERWFWVGLNKRNPDSKGSWEWSDSRPVSLVTLPFDFKEDDYAIRDCGAFQTQRPLWHHFMMIDVRKKFDYHLMPFHCDIKLEWVCQIPKGAKLRRPAWYIPDGESIHGPTVVIDGSEYWFVNNTSLTYQEAELYCTRNESKLASITSRPAIKMIKTHLQKQFPSSRKWWVKAINYNVLSSPFFGSSYLYPRFHFFNNRYRDCWFITPYYVTWREYNDLVDCSRSLPFICQKLNISSLETWSPETNVSSTPCTESWIPFGDNCYNFIKPQVSTLEAGARLCQSLGGNLPSIANSVEQDFIVSHLSSLPDRIWLGMQASSRTGTNKWITGRPVNYTNWQPSFDLDTGILDFDFFHIEKQCAVLLNDPSTAFVGKWDMTACDDMQHVAVCQKHREHSIHDKIMPPLNDTLNFLNHTYTIIRKNLTWEEALTECQKSGYQLVSVTEPYHQAFLTVTVNTLGYPVWIGLYSQDDGLHFRWSDGRHTIFSHWSSDDSAPTDNCVYMDVDGFWRTSDCDLVLGGAICHSQQKELAPEQSDVETVRCPHKLQGPLWIPFRNNCYAFLLNSEKPRYFEESTVHSMCKKLDPRSNILTIRNEEENNFVTEQLIIRSYLYKWVWLSVRQNGNHTMWYDGSYVQYSNWHSGRVKLRNGRYHFLAAGLDMGGNWHHFDHPLQRVQLILQSISACKIEMDPNPSHFEPPPTEYGNHKYMVIQNQVNWYTALQKCQMSGYQLVSVYNESQHLFLKSLVKSDGFPLWIGLFSQDGGSTFEWADGNNPEYKPWEYGHLDSIGSCVFMDTKGIWNRASCYSAKEGAICYASQNKRTLPKQQEKSSRFCPQENGKSPWIRFREHCYAFDMGLYNWSVFTMDETKSVCHKLDPSATTLSIKDREENDFVTRQIQEEHGITGRIWLGIVQHSKDKSLQWLDGSDLTYANWINKNLSVPIHNKCAIISSKNGTWILTSCSNSHSRLVCKAPMRSSRKVAALVITVILILLLLGGMVWYLYKRNKWRWAHPFGTVHYERSYNDPIDSDSTVMISELKEFRD